MSATKPSPSLKRYWIFLLVLGLISLGAIALNLVSRQKPQADAQTVQDLNLLSSRISTFYRLQHRLPDRLSELPDLPAATTARLKNYEYTAQTDQFRLCANFFTETPMSMQSEPVGELAYPIPNEHGRGRQCFDYPVTPASPFLK